jgi:alkylation response protein AidB-like acyl-CoA dehydrogenase
MAAIAAAAGGSGVNRTVETMIHAIREMRPRLESRAREIEAARRVPTDILDELLRLGVFRMNVPSSHGGLELPLRESFAVLTELARVDGSVGWVVMIGSFAPLILGRLPRPQFDLIYRDGADIRVAGGSAPGGAADAVDGGFRVTGRWPFASGCDHADWLFGFCVGTRNGAPLPGPMEGVPPLRIVVLPAKDWEIEDTWFAHGLRGTGSHHIALNDVWVPESNVIDLFAGHANVGGPLFQGAPAFFVSTHSAFALGLAEGAVQDLVDLTDTGKRPVYGRTALKDSPMVQYELGRAEVLLRAARALTQEQCDIDWHDCVTGRIQDLDRTTRRHQSATWINEVCGQAIETCYRLGGASSVYETSPLQRRLRDISAATQHVSVNSRQYVTAGAQRLGHEAVHPLFAA